MKGNADVHEQQVALEQAYRRGYLHGYSEGMDDVRQAAQSRRLSAARAWGWLAGFFDGPLTRWRYADHQGRLDLPPTFDPRRDYDEGAQ